MRIFPAILVFFKVLFDAKFAEQVRLLTDGESSQGATELTTPTTAAASGTATVVERQSNTRSDAITLLATLQREARLIDIVMEPLSEYSDAQVGAATRDVLRDCGQALERLFAIRSVAEAEEGASYETPAQLDAALYRLTGNVTGDPPYRGQLVHHGWQATRCELPSWSGSSAAAMIVAPVELELT